MNYRLAFVLGALSLLTPGGQAQEPPNIVLVMADDQGWGDMAYNGHPRLKTPNFDKLAREGVRFDHFYAQAPVCSPTRGSVLTGRHPNRFGCFQWGHPLRPQETTFLQLLRSVGYRTGHFGKWHLGSMQKAGLSNPGAAGFDTWTSSPNFFDLDPILSVQGKATQFKGDSSDVTAEIALKFIRDCHVKKERFAAVVWFGSPHNPHEALEADRKPYADLGPGVQNFYGEITAMDRAFGKIREELRQLGLSDNTILWYCSDNGALPKIGSAGGRRGRKASLYEGGVLVPALLEWPAKIPAPRVVATPCVTSDIFPTLLELAGVKAKDDRPLDGISLLPLLTGKAAERSNGIGFWNHPSGGVGVPAKKWMDELYAEQQQGREPSDPARLFANAGSLVKQYPLDQFPGHSAWVDGGWKLHRIQDPKGNKLTLELYHLTKDPNETTDLLKQEGERVGRMQRDLEVWLQSVVRSLNGEDYKK